MPPIRLAIVLACAMPVACEAVAVAAPAASLQFRRDPALLRAKQAQLIEATRARDPKAAAQLAKAFEGDLAAAVAPAFRPYGYSTDDAADMTAAYWIVAWEASRGLVGTATDPAVAKGVRAQLARVMAPELGGRTDAAKQDVADTMLLQMLLVDARMRAAQPEGPAALKAMSDTIHREASTLLKVDLRAVDMSAKGFTPVAKGRTDPSATPPAAPGPTATGSAGPVAGTYFRAIAGSGAAIDFEPLVFFANGDYVELGVTPVSDLDPAADKARSPTRWGRWRQQGGTFLLTNNQGRTYDYRLGTGNFFPAFAAAAGPRLAGTYSNTTGGGNAVMGVTTLAVDRIVFNPDGTFSQGKAAGGIAPNAAIGNRSRAAGRWRLDGSALVLDYADGRRVRTSFLWAARGSPPRPDAGMAFIGGDAFTRDD